MKKPVGKVLYPILAIILWSCVPLVGDDPSITDPSDLPVDPNSPIATGETPPAGPGISVIPGNEYLLYWGDLLAPEGLIRNGQMLVSPDGTIEYVGTDASAHPQAAGATRIIAPDGLAGPGLIDADRHVRYWGEPITVARDQKYDHRHEWWKGLNGHSVLMIPSVADALPDEIQGVLDGVTSAVQFSSGVPGLMRNLAAVEADLDIHPVNGETFPLGDAAGDLTLDPDSFSPVVTGAGLRAEPGASILEASMGLNDYARTEFLAMTADHFDLLAPRVSLAGGAGLASEDLRTMALSGVGLIWTPRSDLNLYGDTARVSTFHRLGGKIALGSYWNATGSLSVQRELRAAYEYNKTYLSSTFNTRELYAMATSDAADLVGAGTRIGRLAAGYQADFVVYRKDGREGYDVPIMADPERVALVFRSGIILSGDSELCLSLPHGLDAHDDVLAGSTTKSLFLSRETGTDWAAFTAAYAGSYGVQTTIDSGYPVSAIPARPSTSVPTYDGVIRAGDKDGDGIADAQDLAPSVFNPIRPLDSGSQQDADGDGLADEADPAPWYAGTSPGSVLPAPTGLAADSSAVYPIGLSWNEVAGADGYQVYRDSGDAGTYSFLVYAGSASACFDGFAEGGSLYRYKVRAYDAHGPGAFSTPLSATVPDVELARVFNAGAIDAIPPGSIVSIRNVYVTEVSSKGFYLQEPEFADFSAGYVYAPGTTSVARGNRISLKAEVSSYYGAVQLRNPVVTVEDASSTLPFAPWTTAGADAADGSGAFGPMMYRLVQVDNQAWSYNNEDISDTSCVFILESGIRINNALYSVPAPTGATAWSAIRGILMVDMSGHQVLCPREPGDLVEYTP